MDEAALIWMARVGSAAARVDWPALAIDGRGFRSYLERRVDETQLHRAVLFAGDLALAWACIDRQPAAIRAFDVAFLSNVSAIVAGPDSERRDDLLQSVRERIHVGTRTTPPRIARYRGTSSLSRWVRLIVLRAHIDLASRPAREVPEPTPAPGLELDHVARVYQQEFAAAFAVAARSLERSERRMLLLHHVDHRTLDELAQRERIHRVTMARRLSRARVRLRVEVMSRLRSRLGRVGDDTLDDVVRSLEHQPPIDLLGLLEPTESTISVD